LLATEKNHKTVEIPPSVDWLSCAISPDQQATSPKRPNPLPPCPKNVDTINFPSVRRREKKIPSISYKTRRKSKMTLIDLKIPKSAEKMNQHELARKKNPKRNGRKKAMLQRNETHQKRNNESL
jgi:hypothetical protein